MEKPWLSRYPEGVPAEIDLSGYNSILDIYQESLEKFRDRPAYMNFGKEITFNDWDRLSRDFGAYLQSLGLQKGDRIALMMPNIMQYPVAIMGALRAGLIVVNTNPMYTARELRHQLTDSGAKAIVVVENFADVLEKKNARVSLQQIIRELEATQETVWSPIILNGSGFGLVANHSLVMASYISRANAAIIDLRDLLLQG